MATLPKAVHGIQEVVFAEGLFLEDCFVEGSVVRPSVVDPYEGQVLRIGNLHLVSNGLKSLLGPDHSLFFDC